MNGEVPPRLREWAREQAGVISRQQAIRSGMSEGEIKARVISGRWPQIHRGVYSTYTGPPSRSAQLWAAVLYAGRDAMLSHETAAEVLGLTAETAKVINLTVPAVRRVRPQEGMVVHLSFHNYERWRPPYGVPPHTFIEDTIIDLVHAATSLDDAIAWVTAGFNGRMTDEARLRAGAAGRKKLRWRDRLDEVIPMAAGGTHSVLEYHYDRDVEAAHGLPPARKQAKFARPDGKNGFRDRYYPEYGLVIELDGRKYHQGEQRGRDRRRDNDVTAASGATLRYEWLDVTRDRCVTAAQVHQALSSRGYAGELKRCGPTCSVRSTALMSVRSGSTAAAPVAASSAAE